jgi:hypothetical protein|tara:strand:+ start:92 stop:265 length:174 start_codon:yes stop_codon:yes gene_type:complete
LEKGWKGKDEGRKKIIIIALNVRREMFGLKRTHKKRREKYAGVNTHGRRSSTTQQCT